MHRKLWLLPLVALLGVMMAFGAACGDDDDDGGVIEDPIEELTASDSGDATLPPTDETPADGAETPADGAETPADGEGSPAAGGDGGATVDIAADSAESFSTETLTADAGSVTIVFENNDDGVPHNFALFDSPDSAENLIDATEVCPGPCTNEITVELEPGDYYYHCDVHPTTMTGVLTVE